MSELSRAAELAAANAAGMKLYARQWLDADAAEDAVQEALVSLLSLKKCPEDPVAWMYVAVRNRAIDQARSGQRRKRREQNAAQSEWFEASAGASFDAEEVQHALRRLPREVREIVVLRVWGGLGYAMIARIAQISVGTAHQRFEEAMKELRRNLFV
ncbi:MAG TPA: RNA polymerase sigma factor [Tepidisphaeraceae bacterium]|nr:RNA polymerase sigma factor [Tepidisphaeraceae bacterium]